MSLVLELKWSTLKKPNTKKVNETFSVESIEFVPGFLLVQAKDGTIDGIPSFHIDELRIIQEDNGEGEDDSGA
jgi:hypothetical protein